MPKTGVTRATANQVSKRFAFYLDEAIHTPVAIEQDGTVGVVMISAAEYERLIKLDHVALHPSELSETELAALRNVDIPESAKALDHLMD